MATPSELRLPLREILMRSLAVGFAYALASALVAGILGPLSRLAPTLDNLLVWLISGTVVALALAPFILHSSWSRQNTRLAAWAVLAFVRSLGLGIEGSLFEPTQAMSAIIGAVFGLLVGLLIAWLAVRLFYARQSITACRGLGPYLEVTFRTMPLGFNLATLAEIFLQNFLTGLVAANLFQPKQSPA